MRRLRRPLLVALGTYCALLLLAFLGQRLLIYPAPPGGRRPQISGALRLEHFVDDGGLERSVLFAPPRADQRCVVFFHGNGMDNADVVWIAQRFHSLGVGVLSVEYPGYGWPVSNAQRSPNEQGLYAAGTSALAWLRRQGVSAERTVLVGHSLGTGVAMELARRQQGRSLVLLAPYRSMGAMAQRVAPFFPAQWLVLDRYDNLGKAPELRVPTLVVHGGRDAVIPVEMGRELAQRIPHARYVELPERSHFLLGFYEDPVFELVQRFANE